MDSLSNTSGFNASDALKELLSLKEETRLLREQRQRELLEQQYPTEEEVEAQPILSERDKSIELIKISMP